MEKEERKEDATMDTVIVPVSPDEAASIQRRRRVAPNVVQQFLDSGLRMARIDREQLGRPTIMSLVGSLNVHIRSNLIPVRIFQRRGEVYLERTDAEETAKDVAEPG